MRGVAKTGGSRVAPRTPIAEGRRREAYARAVCRTLARRHLVESRNRSGNKAIGKDGAAILERMIRVLKKDRVVDEVRRLGIAEIVERIVGNRAVHDDPRMVEQSFRAAVLHDKAVVQRCLRRDLPITCRFVARKAAADGRAVLHRAAAVGYAVGHHAVDEPTCRVGVCRETHPAAIVL